MYAISFELYWGEKNSFRWLKLILILKDYSQIDLDVLTLSFEDLGGRDPAG